MNKLTVSLSPHVHGGDSVKKNMYGVCLALLPALVWSLYYFGLGALVVLATSVLACVFFEWAITKFLLRRENLTVCDGSAALTGLLLGFNLPSNLPLWIIILGALFAIGVGKLSYGGLGQNPFNPALVGRVFLLISFPVQMTTWPVGRAAVDAATGPTPLSVMQNAIATGDASLLKELPSSLDMLVGQTGGSLGEVSAICLLLGCLFMLWRKIITWHIPVSILFSVFLFSGLLHVLSPVYANPVQVVLSGGLMLGACFMATDYVTSPMTGGGQILYGVCIGLLTVVIRNWGAYPEGMSFINTYCKPKRFGRK